MKICRLSALSILVAFSSISFAASASTPGACTVALQAAVNNAKLSIQDLQEGNGTEALINAAGENANDSGAEAICAAANTPNTYPISLDIATAIGSNAATASLIAAGNYPLATVYLVAQIDALQSAVSDADGQ